MKICSYCNGDSPIDAIYCINCGALFQANTSETHRLTRAHEKEIGPYIDKTDYGFLDSDYISPFVLPPMTIRLSKRQVMGLKDNIELIGDSLYLHGHRIIIID